MTGEYVSASMRLVGGKLARPAAAALSGTVKKVVTRKADTGWTVLIVTMEGGKDATVVATIPAVEEGLRIECEGNWKEHDNYGRQFVAESARTFVPNSVEGLEKFLASGLIEGVGAAWGKKLVKTFGAETLDVCVNRHHLLRAVKGMTATKAAAIHQGVKKFSVDLDTKAFLHSRFGPVMADRVFTKYGAQSITVVSRNPYQLIDDIEGIAFLTADRVAQTVGIEKTSANRIAAALKCSVQDAGKDGHTCLTYDMLLTKAAGLTELAPAQVKPELDKQITEGGLIAESFGRESFIYTKRTWQLESGLAKRLCQLRDTQCSVPYIAAESAIQWVQNKLSMAIETKQRAALMMALTQTVSIIHGGPGRGKTHVTRALAEIYTAKRVPMALCAPTGRAAKRLSQASGCPAQTIHRLLGVDGETGRFIHNEDNLLPYSVIVLDETSMADLSVVFALVRAIRPGTRLVIIGDPNQLASVGVGRFLYDVLASQAFPEVKLTYVFRQSSGSAIVDVADQVNEGVTPNVPHHGSEVTFVDAKDSAAVAKAVLEAVTQTLPAEGYKPFSDVQVLAPKHDGVSGVKALNAELQKIMLPSTPNFITRDNVRYGIGDKVLQLRNDRELEVFNGDIGTIQHIDKAGGKLTVDFEGLVVGYPIKRMANLTLAYATSVHKMQGCEVPAVVMALDRSSLGILDRQLLYTAITRAKRRVILVGQRRTLHIATKTQGSGARMTHLMERLRKAY